MKNLCKAFLPVYHTSCDIFNFLHAVTSSHILHLDGLRRQIEIETKSPYIMLDHPWQSLYTQCYTILCDAESLSLLPVFHTSCVIVQFFARSISYFMCYRPVFCTQLLFYMFSTLMSSFLQLSPPPTCDLTSLFGAT